MNEQRDNESIGSLFGRLLVDGKACARAEVDIYRQKALSWVPPIRAAAILLVVALFLAQAAITTLLVGFGVWLGRWVGPFGGGAIAALVGLMIAGLLTRAALSKLRPPGGQL